MKQHIQEALSNLKDMIDVDAVTTPVTAQLKQDMKKKYDAFKDMTETDDNYLGAKKQPVPKKVEVPKAELSESLFEDASLEQELSDFLAKKGYDVTSDDAKNYIASAAEYISDSRDYTGEDYSIEDWYADTQMNYPEDLEMLKDPVNYEKIQNAPNIFQWNYSDEEVLNAINYCEDNNIDYTSLSPDEFEEIAIKANNLVENLTEDVNDIQQIKDCAHNYIFDMLESDVESNLALQVASECKQYDPEWCADPPAQTLDSARDKYISALLNDLFDNAPVNESLTEMISDSSFKSPSRIRIKAGGPKSYSKQRITDYLLQIINSCQFKPEILNQSEDEIIITVPGRQDWVDKLRAIDEESAESNIITLIDESLFNESLKEDYSEDELEQAINVIKKYYHNDLHSFLEALVFNSPIADGDEIIKELADYISDDDYYDESLKESLAGKKVFITEIDWDVDKENIDLPTEVVVTTEDLDIDDFENAYEATGNTYVEGQIEDWLSNKYGSLVNSYSYYIGDNPYEEDDLDESLKESKDDALNQKVKFAQKESNDGSKRWVLSNDDGKIRLAGSKEELKKLQSKGYEIELVFQNGKDVTFDENPKESKKSQ